MSMNCFSGNVKTLEVCVLHNYISFIISRKITEGKLFFTSAEETSSLLLQPKQLSSSPKLDVAAEGETVDQVEGEIHRDH